MAFFKNDGLAVAVGIGIGIAGVLLVNGSMQILNPATDHTPAEAKGTKQKPDATKHTDVRDHPPGNTQQYRTTNTFKSIKYFLGGPYDPVNGPHYEDAYDLHNIPRRDYFTPTGSRIRTFGNIQHGRSERPGWSTYILPGMPIGAPGSDSSSITPDKPYKNLHRHPTLMESQYEISTKAKTELPAR